MKTLDFKAIIIIVLSTLLAGNIIFSVFLFFRQNGAGGRDQFAEVNRKIEGLENKYANNTLRIDKIDSLNVGVKEHIRRQEELNRSLDGSLIKINEKVKKQSDFIKSLNNQDGFGFFANWISTDF